MSVRVEEWRVKRRDTEEWMRHRQLPPELQERVRRFVQYKWLATRGVDEESILQSLPTDLRREIQRHLCLALVRRVHTLTLSLQKINCFSFHKSQYFATCRSRSSHKWMINFLTLYADVLSHL